MGILKRRSTEPPPTRSPRLAQMDDAMLYAFVEASVMEASEWLSQHRRGIVGAAAFAHQALTRALDGAEELARRG